MSIKIQLYLQNAADAIMCAQAGTDFVGLVSDGASLLPGSLDYGAARAVFAAVPERVMKVALSIEQDVDAVKEMVTAVEPDVLHLAGAPFTVEQIINLRAAIPTVKIMQAIPMNTGDPIILARHFQAVCDYFLLDTNDPDADDIGATGQTHDWNVSARLVQAIHIPVILAGGLSADNVAAAIKRVRPWGVDSFSLTNVSGTSHGSAVRKDPDKVKAFISNAKSAW